jgi:hypothetical protein
MKNIKRYIASLLLTGAMFSMFSCEVEEDEYYFKGKNFVAFNQESYSVFENGDEPLLITIGASIGNGVKEDVTIEYTVGGTAVEGVDYNLNSPLTVTIPAGENNATIEIEPINNAQFDLPRTIELTITSVSDPNLTIGINSKDKLQSSVSVSLVNDDCQVNTSPWEGTVTGTRASTGGTHTTVMGKNTNGDCNILSIKSNSFALNAAGSVQTIQFIPASEGAKTGAVRMPKQNIGLRFGAPHGVLTVESNGDGAYDEVTGEFWMNVTMRYEDGTIFRQDKYTFKKSQ